MVTNNFEHEMQLAVTKWRETHGVGMTGRELETARAWFADRRNSRQVGLINIVLRARLLGALRTEGQ